MVSKASQFKVSVKDDLIVRQKQQISTLLVLCGAQRSTASPDVE
jgi:hypothetical protein